MHFSGEFVKVFYAESCLAIVCLLFLKSMLFPTAQILTLWNWIEIAVGSLGHLILSMETAVDFKIGKFGTGCSQVRKLNTTFTFGKFFGFVTFREQIFLRSLI